MHSAVASTMAIVPDDEGAAGATDDDIFSLVAANDLVRLEAVLTASRATSSSADSTTRLASQADPDLDNETPLHMAADRGHTAAIMLLLRFGAEVDARSDAGATPLMYACTNGHAAAAKALVQAGASLLVRDTSGRQPLDCCDDATLADQLRGVAAASQ